MTDQTVRLTAAQALVRFLSAQYTERDGIRRRLIPGIFGIFGHGNAAGIGQALAEADAMPVFQGKNEQAMVHAALGFAKASQRLSALAVTTSLGPGAANLVTGAASATVNRLPVLLLPGDVFATRRPGTVLQQLEHSQSFDITTNDALRPVSRYFDRITRPEQLIDSLPQAVAALLDQAEAGAVTLALCQDVQGEAFDWPRRLFAERTHHVHRRPPAPSAVEQAVNRVGRSRRPLIICGGGVVYSGAADGIDELSARFGIPVAETYAGRSASADTDLTAGGIGLIGGGAANDLAARADLVIAVGTRLTDVVTGSRALFQDPDAGFVSINLSRSDLAKNFAVPVDADAKEGLRSLIDALGGVSYAADPQWTAQARSAITAWKSEAREALSGEHSPMRGYEVIRELARYTGAEDRVIFASSTAIGYAHSFWTGAGQLDLEYGYSCMGYEIPAAIGHRLAGCLGGQPAQGGDVYTVLGDGSYLMGYPGELVTAIQDGLRFTAIVLVNDGWQCINRFELGAIGRTYATQFKRKDPVSGEYAGAVVPVDYAANAISYGARGFDVHSTGEFRKALEESRTGERPCVIAVHVTDEAPAVSTGTWWDFGIAAVGGGATAPQRRADHLRHAAAQRWLL